MRLSIRPTTLLRIALVAMSSFIIFLCILMFSAFLGNIPPIEFRLMVLGLYTASLPFHYALYQAWKLLGLIDNKMAFTPKSVKALQTIKTCAVIIAGLFILYSPIIMAIAQREDAPGVFAFGLMITFMSAVIAVFTGLLQRLFQNAVDIKNENDLTV